MEVLTINQVFSLSLRGYNCLPCKEGKSILTLRKQLGYVNAGVSQTNNGSFNM